MLLRHCNLGRLTAGLDRRECHRMEYCQDCGYPSDVPVEDIEGRIAPASQPEEDVVSSGKNPQNWQGSITDLPRPISYIPPLLVRFRVAAVRSVIHLLSSSKIRRTVGLSRKGHMRYSISKLSGHRNL